MRYRPLRQCRALGIGRGLGAGALALSLASVACRPLGAGAAGTSLQRAEAAEAVVAARSALKSLATAEEAYFADHLTYTADTAELAPVLAAAARSGVDLRILDADSAGWRAIARHRRLRAWSCVIFVGTPRGGETLRTAGGRVARAEDDSAPVCDEIGGGADRD